MVFKKKINSKKTRSTPLKSRYNNQSHPEVTVDKMEPIKHSLSQMFIIGESVTYSFLKLTGTHLKKNERYLK